MWIDRSAGVLVASAPEHGASEPTLMSLFIPSKSSPTVFLSKYAYCLTSSPASREMGMWFPQVGVGR